MQGHRRRRDRPATPTRPEGCGGMAPLSLSLLLANEPGIDSSSLREIGAIALATNVTVFMNRGTKVLSALWAAQSDPSGDDLHPSSAPSLSRLGFAICDLRFSDLRLSSFISLVP